MHSSSVFKIKPKQGIPNFCYANITKEMNIRIANYQKRITNIQKEVQTVLT